MLQPLTPWNAFKHRIKSALGLDDLERLYKYPFLTTKTRSCPICGGRGYYEHTNTCTALDRCENCGHVYSRKVPGRFILRRMYGDFEYWIADKKHQGIEMVEEGSHWSVFLDARIGIIEKVGLLSTTPQHFYEIGCSEGILLKELQNRGHIARGCEMNESIAKKGSEQLGIEIDTALFEDLDIETDTYDAVLSFHTIEHLVDPKLVLAKIAGILKPDGVVLIEVPCGPEEYDNTDHLQFFCKESLLGLLDNYFEQSDIIENRYTNEKGIEITSLYGIGRVPLT